MTDDYGNAIGRTHRNPTLDMRQYKIELEDGMSDRIFANKIAANIYSQVDDEGREILKFKEILDHKSDETAVVMTDLEEISDGHHKPSKTTRGWLINVEMADDSTHWVNLSDVKESNPIEMAEYTVSNEIDKEPVFS